MKILGRFKAEKATFYKVSGYKTTIYHSWYLETFWKQALGTFRVWERQMNWIWCQNINYPSYQTEVISLLRFSMTLRQGCRNVTMGPWIIHILRSSQSWCNIGATRNIDLEKTMLILTLPLQHCIDVAIKISMICCEIKLLSNAEATLISNCEFYAVVFMFWRIC